MEAENLEPTESVDNSEIEQQQVDPQTQDWREVYGVQDQKFEKFASPAELAKSYNELESFMGSSVRIPSEEAGKDAWAEFDEKLSKVEGMARIPAEDDTDGWNKFYSRIGRPSAPENYLLDTPEEFEESPESLAEFKAKAYEAGLSTKQAKDIHGWLTENIVESNKAMQEQSQAAMNDLKGQWGQKFDHNVQQAQNMAKVLNDKHPGLMDYLDAVADGGGDAMMVALMYEMSQLAGETGAMPTSPTNLMTPEEALLRISEIRNNPEHPYNNEMDSGHEAAKLKMRELYKFANP